MKISKNFRTEEFVPKEIFQKYGQSSLWFVRPQIVYLAQVIRDYFNKPVIINDWYKGGNFNERGFRVPESKTGSKLSQHKLAGAIDFTIEGYSPDEVRSSILDDPKRFVEAGLTTLEDGMYAPTWVHADIRLTNVDEILIVRPASIQTLDFEGYNPAQDEYFVFDNGELISIPFPLYIE